MFRRSMRPFFLLLMGSFAAAPAGAAVDVTTVTLDVTINHTSLAQDDFDLLFEVHGTGLNSGTLTVPTVPPTVITLDEQAGVLVWEKHFTSEGALNIGLPNGSYTLRVNNATATSILPYTRPAVPSPAISFPGEGDVIPPGTVTVAFTKCTVCNLSGDSVEAVLTNDLMVVLDSEVLTESDETWTPQDVGGDLVLPPQSAFVVKITHQALRENNFDINDDDDMLTFQNTFTQSDELDFETGFEAPSGHFCLSANHPAPPAGCNLHNDTALQLFDTSGMNSTTVDGHDVDYVVSVEAGGSLSGTATADLDNNGSNETGPGAIKGKLGGGNGEASSKLSFSLSNTLLPAKLKVSVTDDLSIPADTRTRLQRASGSIGASKIKEDVPSTDTPLPDAPLGWVLEYDLAADGTISNAKLTLEGGRIFGLTGTNKFNFSANESGLKLSSDPKGISMSLKGVGLDDASSPMAITGGDLSYKALGQSGRVTLP
jgi:hypothetical protein